LASAWGKAWGKAWGAAWGRIFAPVQQPAGALAGNRPTTDTKRLADPATARAEALQTTDRPDQLDTTRPQQTDTTRTISAPTLRPTQTNISSRPANTGGRRK